MVTKLVLLWMVAMLETSSALNQKENEGVDTSNKALKNISGLYNKNITWLILHNNSILMNSLDVVALQNYSMLKELDLSYNCISQLPIQAFSNLSYLESLNLRGNKLQTLNNATFSDIRKLKQLDLGENPWNCSSRFLEVISWMNNSGVQIERSNMTCSLPQELAGKLILDVIQSTSSPTERTVSNPTIASTVTRRAASTTSQVLPLVQSTPAGNSSVSNQDGGKVKRKETNNTWKFLMGIIIITVCISTVILFAIKSPSWYKMLFNYRHQRLREQEEPHVFNTGRHSNFSLDTEQTETSASELDQGLSVPDEDGFIEDGYIQAEDYKEQNNDADL